MCKGFWHYRQFIYFHFLRLLNSNFCRSIIYIYIYIYFFFFFFFFFFFWFSVGVTLVELVLFFDRHLTTAGGYFVCATPHKFYTDQFETLQAVLS